MILFLDFDGVAHRKNANINQFFECMPVLWELLRKNTNINVVISSSWKEQYSFCDIQEMCTSGGGKI